MALEPLKVTPKTTFNELRTFSDQVGERALYGKANKDGSITLYVSDSASGPAVPKEMKPLREACDLARQAVQMVFDNTARSMAKEPMMVSFLLNPIRNALDKTTAGELKGIGLKLLLDASDRGIKADRGDVHGPGLRGSQKLDSYLQTAPKEIRNFSDNKARESLVVELSGVIATDFLSPAIPEKTRENLALSNGRSLKEDLRSKLQQQFGPDLPLLKSPALEGILDDVFQRVAKPMLKNRQIDANTIQIGGDKYVREKRLGVGAFGEVDLYKCGKKFIALKIPKDSNSDTRQEVGRELRAHRLAHGPGGHKNVLGLLGPVRLQNNQVGVALEVAPNKSVHHAVAKIANVTGKPLPPGDNQANGDVAQPTEMKQMREAVTLDRTQVTALRLTMLKDIIEGLKHLSENGIVHRDFRTPNIFIGEGGVAKIADFGLSVKTSKFVPDGGAINAETRAPEECIEAGPSDDPVKTKEALEKTTADIRKAFGGLNDKQVGVLVQNVRKHEIASSTDRKIRGDKVDEWQLGVMAFQLMFDNRLPFAGDSVKIKDRYADFGRDPSNRAIDTQNGLDDGRNRPNGAFAGSTGNKFIDDLLNQLLHPDPDQRPDMATLLDHPAFKLAHIGTPTTRNLLVALMQDDAKETKKQMDLFKVEHDNYVRGAGKLTPSSPPGSSPTN